MSEEDKLYAPKWVMHVAIITLGSQLGELFANIMFLVR